MAKIYNKKIVFIDHMNKRSILLIEYIFITTVYYLNSICNQKLKVFNFN